MVTAVCVGHGGVHQGQAEVVKDFVVPEGVTIYFFVPDGWLLKSEVADMLTYLLLSSKDKVATVKKHAMDVKKGGDKIRDWRLHGGSLGGTFKMKGGVYELGSCTDKVPPCENLGKTTPAMDIPDKTYKHISQIICGASGNGKLGAEIFWLACRQHVFYANLIPKDSFVDKKIARFKKIPDLVFTEKDKKKEWEWMAKFNMVGPDKMITIDD